MSNIDTSFGFNFPAIRGIQANNEYFVCMCPLKFVPKLFANTDEDLKPNLRSQRVLNQKRIPSITRYILDNPNSYIFSAITASVDGDVKFVSAEKKSNFGNLWISADANVLINDGQHRKKAIEAALEENSDLQNETISVVVFIDKGLKRSQQMFADLNRYAAKVTKSLGLLYDHRDSEAEMIRKIINSTRCFNGVIEFEKNSLSPLSKRLFTFSAIYTATKELFSEFNHSSIEKSASLAAEFWQEVSLQLPEWGKVQKGDLLASEVRQDFIHTHGIFLTSIAHVGNYLLRHKKVSWKKLLSQLGKIDWRRNNSNWEGRCMIGGGRISKARINVILTSNYIKNKLGISLEPDEELEEQKFNERA